MTDKGWVMNMDGRRWELRGQDWDTVHGVLTQEFVARAGEVMTVRACRRHGWPLLTPGSPWWHCVLSGGPLDGLHEFLDPSLFAGPPEQLTWPGRVYRRQIQMCGHGQPCGYPYTYDAPRSPYPDTCQREAGR